MKNDGNTFTFPFVRDQEHCGFTKATKVICKLESLLLILLHCDSAFFFHTNFIIIWTVDVLRESYLHCF